MRRGWILAVACPLVGAAPEASAAPAPAVHASAHYRLEVNGDIGDPADFLRLAEALYVQLAAYHGAAPPTRNPLEIRFWETREAYLAGGEADGLTRGELDAGGYYATTTRRAYFWRQPNRYATRHLFLHELTHQFQYLAVLGGSRREGQAWYLEGMAEEFAYHRWDGTTLQTGCSDVVCLEQRIAQVRRRAREGAFDLAAVIAGRTTFDRGDFWAVVHFLRHGADPATQRLWKALERKLWKGAGAAVVARELCGGRRGAALTAAARAWVAGVPHTWAIEWINWDMHGDAIDGWSDTQALLRTHAVYTTDTWITATLEPGPGRAAIGVGQRDRVDFLGLACEADGTVHFVGRASGGQVRVDPAAPVTLRLDVLADGSVRGTANGTLLTPATVQGDPAAGHCALLVGAGRRRFRDWAVAPPP